jgi:hypothetical protein
MSTSTISVSSVLTSPDMSPRTQSKPSTCLSHNSTVLSRTIPVTRRAIMRKPLSKTTKHSLRKSRSTTSTLRATSVKIMLHPVVLRRTSSTNMSQFKES